MLRAGFGRLALVAAAVVVLLMISNRCAVVG
jgi:hypothetical protein